MNTTLATWLPFVPNALATDLLGQFQWWLMGFLFALTLCTAAEAVRYVRRAGGHYAP